MMYFTTEKPEYQRRKQLMVTGKFYRIEIRKEWIRLSSVSGSIQVLYFKLTFTPAGLGLTHYVRRIEKKIRLSKFLLHTQIGGYCG